MNVLQGMDEEGRPVIPLGNDDDRDREEEDLRGEHDGGGHREEEGRDEGDEGGGDDDVLAPRIRLKRGRRERGGSGFTVQVRGKISIF